MNFARLNHILIPTTKDERDRFRDSRFGRAVAGPIGRTWFSLTDEGRGLLAVAAIASLMGLDVIHGQNHLLWALAFSLLVASLLVRPLFPLTDLRIDVEGPARVSVGGEARFRVLLTNHGDRVLRSLRIRRPFLPWDGAWRGTAPGLLELAPGERSAVGVSGRFVARGHHHIDAFGVGALLPLGLALGPSRESQGTRFVVVPRIAPVAGLVLPDALRDQGGSVALASHTGESMEFVGLRPYRDGDRPRDLHAPSWARLGVPVVREYQQEYFSRVAVVIDDDGEVGSEAGFEAMISLAAGIVEHLTGGESLIDVTEPGRAGPPLTVGRSLGSWEQALDHLAELTPGPGFATSDGLEALQRRLPALSALVFVAQTWGPERAAWVDGVRRRGIACRVLVVDGAVAQRDPAVQVVPAERIEAATQTGEALRL